MPLGKERSVGTVLKSGPRNSGVRETTGEVGGGELGCLNLSSSQVALLRGASPSDSRILHTFPYIPNE